MERFKPVIIGLLCSLCLGFGPAMFGAGHKTGGSSCVATDPTPLWEVSWELDGCHSTYVDSNPCTGDCDTCVEHGADGELGDCSDTDSVGGAPDGSRAYENPQSSGSFLEFSDAWTGQTEFWVKYEFQTSTATPLSGFNIIFTTTGTTSSNYDVRLHDGDWGLTCNSSNTGGIGPTYSADTWYSMKLHINTVATSSSTVELWMDGDHSGAADASVTCTGSGSSIAGMRINRAFVSSESLFYDHFRIYTSDPDA